jgi:hypothetical protein
MGLGRDDMRKLWRIEFLGEPAIDAGGPAREWFELVTEQIFDPACGLWVASINNQACVDINPGSGKYMITIFLYFRCGHSKAFLFYQFSFVCDHSLVMS